MAFAKAMRVWVLNAELDVNSAGIGRGNGATKTHQLTLQQQRATAARSATGSDHTQLKILPLQLIK